MMKYKTFFPLVLLFFATGSQLAAVRSRQVAATSTRTFLALGDSYTIGESVPAAARFPAQTVARLRGRGIEVSDPVYIARTGWTTVDLHNALASAGSLQAGYSIVTLLIGVNDQYQGMDTAGYRARFTTLLQEATRVAGGQKQNVYVLSIPDYGVTPFGGGSGKIGKEIDDFNSINREVTLAHAVTYIDITPISRQAEAGMVAEDGLHPSAKQYALWADQLAKAIK